MPISGSICERAIVLPGAATPFFITAVPLERERSANIPRLLGTHTSQVLGWPQWTVMANSLNESLLEAIAEDIPFSREMGVGFWYFGRVPFLQRVQEFASTVRSEGAMASMITKAIALKQPSVGQLMLPSYLSAIAQQLSLRSRRFSATQWRIFLEFSVAFSFPTPRPTSEMWDEVILRLLRASSRFSKLGRHHFRRTPSTC